MTEVKPSVRWIIRSDESRVHQIDVASFDEPWTITDLRQVLARRDTIGMVAESIDDVEHSHIDGYMVYELEKDAIRLVSLAVIPDARRTGVGRLLVGTLTRKRGDTRKRLYADIPERNITAQLWLRALGWLATSVTRRLFGDDDGYRFDYCAHGRTKGQS